MNFMSVVYVDAHVMEGGIDEYLPEMTGIVLDIVRNEECCVELKDKAITIMCSIGIYLYLF